MAPEATVQGIVVIKSLLNGIYPAGYHPVDIIQFAYILLDASRFVPNSFAAD